jgi:catechol 2,3-dioxygenase-like lactoylglutathione lyase family enzyme
MNERNSTSAFRAIGAIDYTVILVRDMTAMRHFYEGVLGFPLSREAVGRMDRVPYRRQ